MTNALRDELNTCNPNDLADALRRLNLGNVVRFLTVQLTGQAPAANASQLSTVQSIVLPSDAKAGAILRAFARTGTGTCGELVISAAGTTPAATHVAVAPNGDIAFLAADAYTSVDVLYVPLKGFSVTLTLPCVASVATLPASLNVLALVSATALVGTVTGPEIVLLPGAAPATTKANLSLDHTQVLFNVATDVVTSCTVTVLVATPVDVNAALQASYP